MDSSDSNQKKPKVIINEHRSRSENFEIQIISFVMLVVPFLVAGPLTLMAWEERTQLSSWWTLLSFQVPVVILSVTKITRIPSTVFYAVTTLNAIGGDDNVSKRSNAAFSASLSSKQTKIRSILVYLSITFLCCREHGLLSRGTAYLVPHMAKLLVWIEIPSSLLLVRYIRVPSVNSYWYP